MQIGAGLTSTDISSCAKRESKRALCRSSSLASMAKIHCKAELATIRRIRILKEGVDCSNIHV
jgi:hypothetical protein